VSFVFKVFDLCVTAEFFEFGVEQANGFVEMKSISSADDYVQLAFQFRPERFPVVA
jgi:hypothetical protein